MHEKPQVRYTGGWLEKQIEKNIPLVPFEFCWWDKVPQRIFHDLAVTFFIKYLIYN